MTIAPAIVIGLSILGALLLIVGITGSFAMVGVLPLLSI